MLSCWLFLKKSTALQYVLDLAILEPSKVWTLKKAMDEITASSYDYNTH